MPDSALCQNLLLGLYQGVAEEESLKKFLCRFHDTFAASHSVATIRDRHNHAVVEVMQLGFADGEFDQYEQHYYRECPWSRQLYFRQRQRFHTTEELIPDTDFTRTRFYHEFARPADFRHGAATVLDIPGTPHYLQLGFLRSANQDIVTKRELAHLHGLVPHVQQFLYLRDRFASKQFMVRDIEQLVDQYNSAIMLCDQNGKIIYFNQQAEALVDASGPLRFSNQHVKLVPSSQSQTLSRLIRNNAVVAAGGDAQPGGALRLAWQGKEYEFRISPYYYFSAATLGEVMRPCAIIVIRKSRMRPQLSLPVLRQLYQLTPSEAEITVKLASGATPAEIARERKASLATLRTQIRSVYAKLGVRNQISLVNKVHASVAAVRLDS